jgi:TMEM175 potassium channel family protein
MSSSDGGVPGGGVPESETGRLEAFSDGVLAVIITIMALELKAPVGKGDFGDLKERIPALLVYILSFTFIGIYWNNHHHLLRAARRVTPAVMWSNLHLLFWLSLIPVLTEWIGEHWDNTAPAATYGIVCLASAVAFTILATVIIRADGRDSPVVAVSGQSIKAQASLVLYAGGTVLAFVIPLVSYILYAVVSVIWFIPDRTLGRARDLLHTIDGSGIVIRRIFGNFVYNLTE